MIVVIDNYDSFVFNLTRYVEELGHACHVVRNDAITVDEVAALRPSHIILSPGPKAPDDAGICIALLQQLAATIPILGVCLGHQAIGAAFGGQICRAARPVHGKADTITHTGTGLFAGLPTTFHVGRYHSLVVAPDTLPACLQVTATNPTGDIMALQHTVYPTYGVQFHPESVLTEHGYALLANFLSVPDIF